MEALAGSSAASVLSDCGRVFTGTIEAPGMAGAPHEAEGETLAYHGEVWTNAGGYATVNLPPDAALQPPFAYELRDLEPATSAHITSELENGRFTIATEEPHVKVAWRLTGQRGPLRERASDPTGTQ